MKISLTMALVCRRPLMAQVRDDRSIDTRILASFLVHGRNVKSCRPGINGCGGPSYRAEPSAARSPSA